MADVDEVALDDGGGIDRAVADDIAPDALARANLEREDAVLPNSIVLAFTDRVKVRPVSGNVVTIEIDLARLYQGRAVPAL